MARYSKQREEIKEFLRSTTAHPSAAEVYEKVRTVIPNISLGTVYRNLEALNKDGAAQSFSVDDIARFDGNIAPHPHFCCTTCGRVTDLSCDMDELLRFIKGHDGHKVDDATVLLHGVCRECMQK